VPQGGKKNKAAAYAALWGLDAAQLGFGDFVAAYHHSCDDIGLEAFETAGAIALGLKAGAVRPGCGGVLAALEEISRGSELGRLLGQGAAAAARAWGLPLSEKGPRKNTGLTEAEDFFLDSVGLCAFAYAALPGDAELRAALEALLRAKYGAAFDAETLRFPEAAAEHA
jgi:hypothetical protein